MTSAWPSQPGLGEQVAEVVIAIALALPVVFAFSELRGMWLAGAAASPQAAEPQRIPRDQPIAEQQSPPTVRVLAGGSSDKVSTWGSRVVVLSGKTSLTAHHALDYATEGQTGPDAGKAIDRVEAIAPKASLAREGSRLTQPAPSRASETPREATQ